MFGTVDIRDRNASAIPLLRWYSDNMLFSVPMGVAIKVREWDFGGGLNCF